MVTRRAPVQKGEARYASGTRRATRRSRVLVVDDEEKLLAVVTLVLQDAHDVQVTTDAREALEWIAAGERYDAILCDVMMDPMNGVQFHLELSRRVPDQADRIVFMSGGTWLPSIHAFLARVPNAFIEKPFTEDALLDIVRAKCKGGS